MRKGGDPNQGPGGVKGEGAARGSGQEETGKVGDGTSKNRSGEVKQAGDGGSEQVGEQVGEGHCE